MGQPIDLIIALAKIKQFDQFTDFPSVGNTTKLYIDRSSNVMYRWTGSAYVQVTGGTSNFLGAYDASVNTPAISTGSGTSGDMFIVSTDNLNISPAIDGITELRRGDTLISQPKTGGGTEWIRIETAMIPLAPIVINSDTTISTFDTTYLVDTTSGDITITVPLSVTANQGAFIRVVKEVGTNSVIINATPPQTFLGGDSSFTINNISDSVTVLSSGTASDGWIKIQDSRIDVPVEEIEFLKSGNTDPSQNENWRVIVLANGLLSFQRREGSAWVEKQSVGDSVHTDIFYASGVSGGVRFEDPDNNREVELIRASPGGVIMSFGDENVLTSLVSDDDPVAIIPRTGTTNLIDVNTVDTDSLAGTLFNFQFTSVNGGRIENIIVDTDGLDRVRIEITENASGITVYQNTTLFDFENNNGGTAIPSGRQTVPLERVARIQPSTLYDISISVATSGTINGNATPTFVPYLQYNLLEVEFCDMALQSRVRTLTSDTTINTAEYREYKNNTILFNQDSASDVVLTVTDGVFSNNDELEILFYPVGVVSEGLVELQMGATGTINGSNSLMLLRESSIRIKHISGDDWEVVTSSEHPLTIRRDTPTIPQMTALTQASVNGNSALWILANNQIQANEEVIDASIQVIALRDDLLDQNGNPIPTVLTQKRTVLLEGGTICRIISPTEIRVITTPQMSSTGVRTNSLTVDTTINSDSVSAYRNDLLLFTNTSGVVTLTIEDDIFDEDNEIIVKHFSSSPNMSVGVNVVQEGTGNEIEGQTNLQLRNNTSARLKYIGNNKWRILSSHGMGGSTPVPITPEAHAFSIDIPSRVNVNESPDTVNVSHNLSYSVTNHSLITSSVLHIGASAFVLPLPTIDGVNTATVAVSSIDLSSTQNYDMYIELNMDTALRSNVQVLRVANLPQSEAVYYGVMATNIPATVDINTLTLVEVSQNTTFDADFEIPNTNWAVLLSPANYTVTEILDKTLNQQILSSFTETEDVRTIGTQSYNSYVLQSNAGITATLSTSISVEV